MGVKSQRNQLPMLVPDRLIRVALPPEHSHQLEPASRVRRRSVLLDCAWKVATFLVGYVALVLPLHVAFGNWHEAVGGAVPPIAVAGLLFWLLRRQKFGIRWKVTLGGFLAILCAVLQTA